MQITILNSEKIKVSLSCEDLEKYSLTVDDMDYETTKMRRALWTILDEVRCSTGFDGAKEKIKVRVYPTEKGGCDMYISKAHEKSSVEPEYFVKEEKRELSLPLIYYFSSLEDITRCARAILYASSVPSKIYRHEKGGYILTLENSASEESELFSPLCEFGREISRELFLSSAHLLTLLCDKNAIETFSKL